MKFIWIMLYLVVLSQCDLYVPHVQQVLDSESSAVDINRGIAKDKNKATGNGNTESFSQTDSTINAAHNARLEKLKDHDMLNKENNKPASRRNNALYTSGFGKTTLAEIPVNSNNGLDYYTPYFWKTGVINFADQQKTTTTQALNPNVQDKPCTGNNIQGKDIISMVAESIFGEKPKPTIIIEPTIIHLKESEPIAPKEPIIIKSTEIIKTEAPKQIIQEVKPPISKNCNIFNCIECADDNTCASCVSTDYLLNGKECVVICPDDHVADILRGKCVIEGSLPDITYSMAYSIGSCKNNCGFYNVDCTCSSDCKQRGDCCSDYNSSDCGNIISKNLGMNPEDYPENCIFMEKVEDEVNPDAEAHFICNQCRPGYLIDGKCVETCPEGYITIDHYCKENKGILIYKTRLHG
jgi:hypothetical protein